MAALCALVLLAYSNSWQGGFILDNRSLLADPRIREVTPENAALILKRTYWWPSGESGLYRPFTTFSYLFNYAVLGDRDQPAGYHWINLLLHLGNVLLAYALALRLVRRFWPSLFIAALWAVHPVLTESVTNIVGRADLLAGMAVLSGLLLYWKSAEARGWNRAAWLAALAAVTTIGVFSKESAVAILPLIVLYELVWWNPCLHHRPLLWGTAATLLPIAAMLFARSAVLARSLPAEFPFTDNPIVGADWWTGRLTAIQVIGRYLRVFLWPLGLSCDYSYNQIPLARGTAGEGIACAVVLAAAIFGILLYRWNRTCFFLACFAFLNFLPGSNFLFPIGTIMAERLLYLPALGLAGCLVLAIYSIENTRMAVIAPAVLCLIVAAFGVRTWMRNLDWQSDLAMATASLRVSPNSFKLHRLLAESLFASDPTHANIDAVIAEQTRSLALLETAPAVLRPPDVYQQAGYYYVIKADQLRGFGRIRTDAPNQSAVQALLECIEIDQAARARFRASHHLNASSLPAGDAQAYLLLSIAYLGLEDADKAYQAADTARGLNPLNPRIYQQLSSVLHVKQRNQEAQFAAIEEKAITSLQQGKWQDAADLSERILDIDAYPTAAYLNAMANLHLGRLDQAERSARQAIGLDGAHRNPRSGYVLGLVLGEKHDYRQAAGWLKGYLEAIPNAPDAEAVRRQLDAFETLARANPGLPRRP
jgi:tetratricopeptide (TPR) repeat protein